MEAYGVLKHDLMNDELLDKPPAFSQEWFSEMLDYNVPGGKLNRGMAVYDTLQALKKVQYLTGGKHHDNSEHYNEMPSLKLLTDDIHIDPLIMIHRVIT